jgi:hypothetical protein
MMVQAVGAGTDVSRLQGWIEKLDNRFCDIRASCPLKSIPGRDIDATDAGPRQLPTMLRRHSSCPAMSADPIMPERRERELEP